MPHQPATPDALDLLEQFGTTVAVQREHEIHGQGDAADYCWQILSGCVRTVKLMEDGRRQVADFFSRATCSGWTTWARMISRPRR